MSFFGLTPKFRIEFFYDAILNGTTPPVPVFRDEMYLAKAAGASVTPPAPMTRREFFLAKLAGMDVDDLVPVTREEIFIAAATNGESVETPEPKFREEFYLMAIAYSKYEDADSDEVDVGRVDFMKLLS